MAALVEAVSGKLRRATELVLEVAPGTSDTDEAPTDEPVSARESRVEAARWRWPGCAPTSPSCSWPGTCCVSAERQHASYDARVLGAVLSLLRARLLWTQGTPSWHWPGSGVPANRSTWARVAPPR